MSSITVKEPTSAVVLVTKCLHCGHLHSHEMAHRPQEFDQSLRMMKIEAFPDGVARTCDNCQRNYVVLFAKPIDPDVARLRRVLLEIENTLRVPAAEYVPAIGDVFTIIDKARANGTGQPGDERGSQDGTSSHVE